MRRQLIWVFLAGSTMVALAFVVPLGFLVRSTAQDRAIDVARADAAAVIPALVAGSSPQQIQSAMGATTSGRQNRLTILTANGWRFGPEVEESERVDAALDVGTSDIGDTRGGVEVVVAVAGDDGRLSAIRVFVPETELRQGQWRALGALAAVALTLIGLSVFVADRLAVSIVKPTQQLALAARRLGRGDLNTRVEPDGPDELVELSQAFNELGSEVSSMLARERELVAELSHRLRTPLTKLRMRIDQVDEPSLSSDLRRDTDDLTRVVNDLIGEARDTAGIGTPQSDAATVVRERTEFWAALADDQQRPWRFDHGGGTAMVPVSAGDLSAAVDVLIDNVFTHTPDRTALVVGYRAAAGEVGISVGDGGPGLDAQAVDRGVSGSASTGLGLDIARRTAEHCGGRLEVGTSQLGGTEVRLVLPIVSPGTTRV